MTSGTSIYQVTRDALITASIGKLGVLAAGQSPTTEDISKAAMNLNFLVAQLRAKGIPLWARKEYTLTLSTTNSYLIGIGQTVNTPYPLKMLDAYVEAISGNNTRIPIDIIAKSEYNVLPRNSSSGQPIKLAYQPFNNYGEVSIWPTPDISTASTYQIVLTYQRPFEYFTASTDMMDFPEQYYLPIVYKLAVLLAPDWGIPLEDRRLLIQEAETYLKEVEEFGEEDGSIFFSPRIE
jgi:hypothetical protein